LNAMTTQIIGGFAGLAMVTFLFRRLAGRSGKPARHLYQKHVALFSADERAFFMPLKAAVAGEYEIFGKLPVDDIITPKKDSPRAAHAISGRYFDFVLCDPRSLNVVCAIQLQDKAEAEPLQTICEGLGLPLLRFQPEVDYSAGEVRETLRKAMVKEPFYLAETDGRKEPRISNLDDMKF
jgi:hypothetical protein